MKEEVGFKADLEYGELHIAGNSDYGFRPFQLMVSSIAVCSGGVLRKVFDKKRLEVEDITIQADVERNKDRADRIEKIHLHFIIKGKDLKEEVVEKSMAIAFKNCSMAQSVKDSIDIKETFEIVG